MDGMIFRFIIGVLFADVTIATLLVFFTAVLENEDDGGDVRSISLGILVTGYQTQGIDTQYHCKCQSKTTRRDTS